MQNSIVFGFIFLIVLGVIAGLVYFTYEKPKQELEQVSYHNFSLIAIDSKTNKVIPANFTIVTEGQTFSGNTLDEGFTAKRIPINNSAVIYMSSQGYYTCKLVPEFNTAISSNVRIQCIMYKVGKLNITEIGRINQNNPLELQLSTQGLTNGIKVCLHWTNSFISANINKTLSEKPNRLKNQVDKCYDFNETINRGNNLNIEINYKLYKNPTEKDFIKAWVIYGDLDQTNIEEKYLFESPENKPLIYDDEISIFTL